MASEAAKKRADHLCIVTPGAEASFLSPLPVRALVGVGPKAEAQLRAAGIETIGGLAGRSRDELVTLFGRAYGRYLSDASRGVDHRTLSAERVAKSISAEHTFPHDTTDRGVLRERLRSQAQEVSARLAQEGLRAEEVAIKLRYANWQTLTRQTKLRVATADAEALAASATGLMQLHWDPTRAVRLIGLRAGRLTGGTKPAQQSLPYDEPPG